MKRNLSKIVLAAALVLGGVTSAWADTKTIGDANKETGFLGAFSDTYTLAPNKTLTLTFTNNGGSNIWNNWVTIAKPKGTTMDNADQSTYYFLLRSDLYGWGQYYNASFMRGTTVDDITGLDGTTVNLTVEREGATIKTRVIATNGTKSYEQDYRSYNVGDGTQDIEILLSVDGSQIIIDKETESITDTNTTEGHTIVGNRDNSTLWWTQYSDYYTLSTNQSLCLDFINYTSGTENAYNWVIGITNDVDRGGTGTGYTEYLILRSDNYGWGDSYSSGTLKAFNYPSDWSTFRTNMNGANVKMTVTRDDNGWVSVYAIMSKDGVSGTWGQRFYFQLPEGMRTEGNIRAFLIADHSYMDIDNTNTTINATKVLGSMDCSTDYLAASTDQVTLTPGSSYKYSFINYNNQTNNWNNFVVPVYKSSDDTRVITIRADNWEDMHQGAWNDEKNAYDYGSNAGCNSDFSDWDNFTRQLNGANIDMTLSFTTDKVFKMASTITTSEGLTWTYSYTSDYSGSAYDLTSEESIKVALSVSLSWLEVLSEEQTAVGVKIADSGYSSLASSYGLDFSSVAGLTAFVVDKITTTAVNMESVEEMPAENGLILKGTAGASYSVPVKSDASFSGTNKLQAAVTATNINANEAYILKNGKFCLVTAASTVPAGKAYLLAEDVPRQAARELVFNFNDDITGIDAIADSQQFQSEGQYYNLAGQRVSKPAKGLYLVNGKKVIIK